MIFACVASSPGSSWPSCCSWSPSGLGGYVYLRQSLPDYDADATVTGLSRAESTSCATPTPSRTSSRRTSSTASSGSGYVHAQDRLWQMEFQRRIGYGRLSEIFGAATVSQDRFLRTVGLRPRRTKRVGPSAGGRATADRRLRRRRERVHRAHHGRRLPPEFTLLRFEPEPFTGPDVHRLGQDDGVGPQRQLLVRADAARHHGEDRRRTHGPVVAAVSA